MSGSFDTDKNIPDLSGKVALVTGGNIGLGRETILQLSTHNPKHIYLGARTESKARDAIASIQKEVPNAAPITWLPLDLTSFSSIKDAAETFKQSSNRLDLLFNNAGIMASPPGTTKEGYEIQFGTNHVGHALFTKLLIPTLLKTAEEPGSDVRIINLSSKAVDWAPKNGVLWDTLKTDMKTYSTWTRYGQSKLSNVHFTRSLAQKYPSIKVIAVHSGAVQTNLISGPNASYPMLAPILKFLTPIFSMTVEEGAWNQLWAASSDKAVSGKFYYPVAQETKGPPPCQNEKQSEALWEWTEKELAQHGY